MMPGVMTTEKAKPRLRADRKTVSPPMQVQLQRKWLRTTLYDQAEDLQPCNRQSKPSSRRRITPRREVYAR
jgi:hypothetical protein